MRIPEIRVELAEVAKKLRRPRVTPADRRWLADRILFLAAETIRRSPVKIARARARAVTDEVRQHVRDTAQANPDWGHRQIDAHCGVDGGRVSEILRGFRT